VSTILGCRRFLFDYEKCEVPRELVALSLARTIQREHIRAEQDTTPQRKRPGTHSAGHSVLDPEQDREAAATQSLDVQPDLR
jgi:hypothetical protein